MLNIKLEAAKRTVELIQEKDQALTNLNITAALKETAREFSEGSKKGENIEGIVRGIIC